MNGLSGRCEGNWLSLPDNMRMLAVCYKNSLKDPCELTSQGTHLLFLVRSLATPQTLPQVVQLFVNLGGVVECIGYVSPQ